MNSQYDKREVNYEPTPSSKKKLYYFHSFLGHFLSTLCHWALQIGTLTHNLRLSWFTNCVIAWPKLRYLKLDLTIYNPLDNCMALLI